MKGIIPSAIVTSLALGCSNPAGVAPPVDASVEPDAAASCLDLTIAVSESEARARIDQITMALWARGLDGTSADIEAGYAAFRSVNAQLDTLQLDPAAAALTMLASLPDSPVHVDELVPASSPDWASIDFATVQFMRTPVSGHATSFVRPAFAMLLIKSNGMWRLASFELWTSIAFATPAEVAALVACTPSGAPPVAGVLGTQFHGMTFQFCGPIGSYDYMPNAQDTLTWTSASRWEAFDVDGGPSGWPVRWRITETGTLAIHPDNYWPTVVQADCYCGAGRVGFELLVDATTGELLRYRPGLGCVVC